MKTLIVIPAYNEELTIGSVVTLARKYGDVLVVDDGSSDRTSEIARNAGVIIIKHKKNRGKRKPSRPVLSMSSLMIFPARIMGVV